MDAMMIFKKGWSYLNFYCYEFDLNQVQFFKMRKNKEGLPKLNPYVSHKNINDE